jgi:hypothetical protein
LLLKGRGGFDSRKGLNMEFNEIAKFALIIVLIGMIVGIGVLILDRMASSEALYNVETTTADTFVWPATGANATLDHPFITSFTSVKNASGSTVPTTNYTVYTTAGKITALANSTVCQTGTTCTAAYTYENRNSTATVTLNAARDALSDLATSWLGLIVLIGALSVILVMVIRSFSGGVKSR